MENVIVAFDGSKHALRAIDEVKNLKKGFPNLEITVLEVIDINKLKDQDLDFSKNFEERQKDRIDNLYKELASELKEFKGIVLSGDPATKIIEHIKDNNYDLLVIGSRGLNSLQEFLLGSVSHKVIKHISIPSLLVK